MTTSLHPTVTAPVLSAAVRPFVYLIEDDVLYHAKLRQVLHGRYSVRASTTGEKGIQELRELSKAAAAEQPVAIILDHHLVADSNPEYQEGAKLLPLIRKALPDVPVIMFSAQEDPFLALRTLDLGAADYIVKQQDHWEQRLDLALATAYAEHELRSTALTLSVRVRRSTAAVAGLTLVILLLCFGIYLYQCPTKRLLAWDPLNRVEADRCAGELPHSKPLI